MKMNYEHEDAYGQYHQKNREKTDHLKTQILLNKIDLFLHELIFKP